MQDEHGAEISDEELLREGLNYLGEAASFLFEIESDAGKAIAFMVDNAIRYGEHLWNDRDPRCSQEYYEDLESRQQLSEMSKEEITELLVKSKVTYNKTPDVVPNCS